MKERLGAADWSVIGLNAMAAGLLAACGRLLQVAAVAVLVLGLWPTLSGLLAWLRTGVYINPTPMDFAPGTARAVITATEWVVVRDILIWFAGTHVLLSAIPAALVVALAGLILLRLAEGRLGSARDVLSRSLRDEYLATGFLARNRRRLAAVALAAAIAAGTLLGWIATRNA